MFLLSMPGRARQDVRVVRVFECTSPWLDDNIMRYVNSPVMVEATSAQCKLLLPWQSPHGISNTNEACVISQAPKFQPLASTALSESGTKCDVVRSLWNAALQLHFCLHTLGGFLQNSP